MKTHITIIILLLFTINIANAQKTNPRITKKKSITTLSPRKTNIFFDNNRSIISFSPKKTDNVSTLNLTALIQGYYNGSSMISVNPIVVTVELHDATTMEGVESQFDTLSSSGTGTFRFTSVIDGVPYYIVVKSPNTIETWSATPVAFNSGVLNYDFTSSSAQAYGNKLISIGSSYCIYSGDVNQDGLVDLSDLIAIDNDNLNYVIGNVYTDVNGDGIVDLGDLILVDNNNLNYVTKSAPPGVPSETVDYAGQTYHTVLIGTQYWLKENLNVGTAILGTQTQTNNGIIEKYCYGDVSANCNTYGGLYQWNEAMQYAVSGGKVQGICPSGWHLPSMNEFSTLATSVAGNSNSLKSVGQGVGSGAGTNESGFSALMAGLRYYSTGAYSDLRGETYIWSSTISGLTNASYMDISAYFANIYEYTVLQDYGFSVRCVKDGWFSLQSPNGGESWKVGTVHNISWTSSNITNAKIELTTNNGTTWSTIVASTPASTDNYSWTIPNNPSTQCKIKISDVSDSTITTTSANLFTIWIPSIALSSPVGGEIWKVGEVDSIKWTSANVANAKIEFTTDNGTNWTTIIGSTDASTGYYPWTIPFTTSVNCKVRITDLEDTTFKSTSPSVFTIANPPCPGQATVLYDGQTYNTVLIGNQCWLKENLNIGSLLNGLQNQANNSIVEKYCYNNVPDSCTKYGGLYQWAEAIQYKNGATNVNPTSPALYGHILGICPSGWHIPDTTEFRILANTVNNDGNSLKAVGQGSYGSAGTNLSGFSAILAGTRYSDGSFSNLGLYNYLASSVEGSATTTSFFDVGIDSNAIYFGASLKSYGRTVRCIKDGSVSILSPNGGETWKVGSNQNITWTSNYFLNAKIDVSTDNGSSWSTVSASTPASSGSYSWTIPNSPSTLCKVRISDAIDTTIMSVSLSTFTIPPVPAITITSPVGGENWKVGEIDTVKWTSANITDTKIEYTTNDGTTWSIVIASTPASVGTYAWTIPNTPSSLCKVKLTDIADTNFKSISTATFSIPPVPTMSITSPNGGENWKVGELDSIKWVCTNVSNAKLELTTNDGTSWSTIVASTPAAAGYYAWTIPDTPSTQCKVRITDVADTNIKSTSANVFTIAVVPTISLTSPVGGENWQVGTVDTIKWTSANVTNAKIEYSTDTGSSWYTIIASTLASIGTYGWTIPNTPSIECKVRISDVADTNIKSISTGTFTIAVVPTVSVTSPNGGESWNTGEIHPITWTSSNITNVKIEYTTDAGSTWTPIIASTAASTGSYDWTIPATPGLCKVRISDESNSAINSTSANDFTIAAP